MNPLVHRLYENKSRKQVRHKNDLEEGLDRTLKPKLNLKLKLESISDPHTEKQISSMMKVPITKLPSIHKIDSPKSKNNFRTRKMSYNLKNNDPNVQFMTELSFKSMNEFQKNIREKIETPDLKNQDVVEFFSYKKPDNQNQDELFQYLRVLEDNPDFSEQFCYMNRGIFPYSFNIVEYQNRNQYQFLTVSLRGITYYKKGQESQFYTVAQFNKDIENYRKIKKINFFSNYVRWKAISRWKNKMVRRKFNQKCKFIENNLLRQNTYIQSYLNFLHDAAQNFSKIHFLDFQISKTLSLEDFNKVLSNKQQQIDALITHHQKTIQSSLKLINEKCLMNFRQEQRVTLGSSDQKTQIESYMPYDNKKMNMRYTQMAKLKQFEYRLYRLIKYTDLVRYSIKIQIIQQGYLNASAELQNLYQKYSSRNERTITSWIYINTQIQKSNQLASIICIPTLQQVIEIFQRYKQRFIKQLFKTHHILIQKKDQLFCNNYDPELQQKPSKLDLRHQYQQNQNLRQLQENYKNDLFEIIDTIKNYLTKQEKILMEIYNQNQINQSIDYYLQNGPLRNYLSSHAKHRVFLKECQNSIEFGLIFLDLKSTITNVQDRFQNKYQQIIQAIPSEVIKRCEKLNIDVKIIYNHFKQNPETIRQHIQFTKRYRFQKAKMIGIEDRIDQLLEMGQMVVQNGIRIGENAKSYISDAERFVRQLNKRFEEIDQNEEKDQKKFEKQVDKMIPIIQQQSEVILKDLASDIIVNSSTTLAKSAQNKLSSYSNKFQKIKCQKQQLFEYQQEMNLGHRTLQNYFKLEIIEEWMQLIWIQRYDFEIIQHEIKQKGYSQLVHIDEEKLIKDHGKLEKAAADLQSVQLLEQFKKDITKLLRIIKLCKMLSSETLQEQHYRTIKNLLVSQDKRIKDLLFTRQGGRVITGAALWQKTNFFSIEKEVSEVVSVSAQQNIIKQKLRQIEQYWKKSKLKFKAEDITNTEVLTLHLDDNEEIQQKLGIFKLTLYNIAQSAHAVGSMKDNINLQSMICTYMEQLLDKWRHVENQWIRLLPLMTNCPSVKHQSNVYFQFTSVNNNMKKFIKNINDMSTNRKVSQDWKQKKYLKTLNNYEKQLREINKTFKLFLEGKRATYSRFYFLTDQELIMILENVRDARSFTKFAGMCFNCEQLSMEKQLISGFQSKIEHYKLRKTILRGEPDQMFKLMEENMKLSMRSMVRTLLPRMRISMNIEQQLVEFPQQVVLLCDQILWGEMAENYLQTTSYEDYEILMRQPYQEMLHLLTRCNQEIQIKLSARLLQWSTLKEWSQQFIRDQVVHNDFKWKEQLKYLIEDQEVVIIQFQNKISYGLEYYPPQKLHVITLNSQRLLYETYNCSLNSKNILINGTEGEGKRNLIHQTSLSFGCYHKQLVCNMNISFEYLMRFVEGAMSSGAWLSFYQFYNLQLKVMGELLEVISKAVISQKCRPSTLFFLVNHEFEVQAISRYQFTNFVVVQPEVKKICQWLMKVYRFKQYTILARQLLGFIQVSKALLKRVMGSQISLMRKVVDLAGKKKMASSFHENEKNIIVQVIRKEIIDKASNNVHSLLEKALAAYFDLQLEEHQVQNNYEQKKYILTGLLQQKQNSILVIGQRGYKTTLIEQVLQENKLNAVRIYPEANQQFFSYEAIDYLNKLGNEDIVWYDGESVLAEWADFITSGYLFVNGRKMMQQNTVIMEMCTITQCSPSFVGKCQIIYLGTVISRTEKLIKFASVQNDSPAMLILQELFGQDLVKMNQNHVEVIGRFIAACNKGKGQNKNWHKIIIWLLAVLQGEQIWNKNYGGRHTDLQFKNMNLIPINLNQTIQKQPDFFILEVPTKIIVLISELCRSLISEGMSTMIYGNTQCGKSSLLNLFSSSAVKLNIHYKTNLWNQHIKKKFTSVRRQGFYYLMSTDNIDRYILVDDVDLGSIHHHEYIRSIIDLKLFRDTKFISYKLNDISIICTSRSNKFAHQKLINRFATLQLQDFTKESFNHIFNMHIQPNIKSHGMNKQVQQLIKGPILRCLLTSFDDLNIILGQNAAAICVIGVLRNLLSLPHKNSYISASNYSQLFQEHLWNRMTEKSFNKKLKWQLANVYENVIKIYFKQLKTKVWIYWDRQYKSIESQTVKLTVQKHLPNLLTFDKMIQSIIFLNNQYHCIDKNVVLLGRKGTGKKYIVEASAIFNGILILKDISSAVMQTIKGNKFILMDSIENLRVSSLYFQLYECNTDADLEKMINTNCKEVFRQALPKTEDIDSSFMLQKVKNNIIWTFIIDNKTDYQQLCVNHRQFLNYPLCLVQQWPTEALKGVFNKDDKFGQIHACIFLTINRLIVEQNYQTMSMIDYQHYLSLFEEFYASRNQFYSDRLQFYTSIHFKFNQACAMIKDWQNRIQILKAQMKIAISNLDQAIMVEQLQSFIMSVLSKQQFEEQKMIADENKKLQEMKNSMEKNLSILQKGLTKIEKIFTSLLRTDLGELKKIAKTNRIVNFGLQCLCILFKEESTQKSIYKVLADPNLLMRMKSSQILKERNYMLELKFNKEIPNLEKQIKANMNETSKILIDWFRAIIQYWIVDQEYLIRKQQHSKHKKTYQLSIQKHIQVKERIVSITQKANQLNNSINKMKESKLETENQLESIAKKLKNAIEIIPILMKAEQQTSETLKVLEKSIQTLRGNCILFAFSAIFLSLKSLETKHRLLKQVKILLQKNLIPFSESFIEGVTGRDGQTFQNLNISLMSCLRQKVIIDPERRACIYLEQKDMLEVAQEIVQIIPGMQDFSEDKIYLTTDDKAKLNGKIIKIDWKVTALNPREKLFFEIAFHKKPEYFETKKLLASQIKKNIQRLDKMKSILYQAICQNKLKILDNEGFVEIGRELVNLQKETEEIRRQAKEKQQLIEELGRSIHEQITKIFIILNLFKQIRNISLQLILDVACKQGDSIQNVINFLLANLHPDKRQGFLFAIVCKFGTLNYPDLLKQVIQGKKIEKSQALKLKKPSLVNSSIWEGVCCLGICSQSLKKMADLIIRNPKQFQQWTHDLSVNLPEFCSVLQDLSIEEILLIFYYLKPHVLLRVLKKIVRKKLNFNIQSFSNEKIIQEINKKFPVVINFPYHYLDRLNHKYNQGKIKVIRATSIKSELSMKKIIWESMQKAEWLVLFGIPDINTRQWIARTAYYVLNYDQQPGFRLMILLDQLRYQQKLSREQKLCLQSKYLNSISVYLYDQPECFSTIIQDYPVPKVNNSSFEGSNESLNNSTLGMSYPMIITKMYHTVLLAHVAVLRKHPSIVLTNLLKRVVGIINYIVQFKIPIQFNVEGVVQYIAKLYSYSSPEIIRKDIEEIFQRICDENQFTDKNLFGIPIYNLPLNQKNIDRLLINNHNLVGCQESSLLHQEKLILKQTQQTLDILLTLCENDLKSVVPTIRGILSRVPAMFSKREITNCNFVYCFQVQSHDHSVKINRCQQLLEWLNKSINNQSNLQQIQTQEILNWDTLCRRCSILLMKPISRNKIMVQLNRFVKKLKQEHDFLLYWNLSLPTFTLHSHLISNLELLFTCYQINQFQMRMIRDAHNYRQQIQFIKSYNNKQVHVQQGIRIQGFIYHQFKYNTETNTFDISYSNTGQQQAPAIVFKLKKNKSKEEDEIFVQLKLCNAQRVQVYCLNMPCKGVYADWNLRDPKLISQQ